MFNKLRDKTFPQIEEDIIKFWENNKCFEKSLEQRKGSESYEFFDGPPFATGLPHYGHLLAGALKDVIPRYWTMKGKYVDRRFGWDCHGLPVEYEMEKNLNLSGKKDIEEYGIDKFNEACRGIVLRYTNEWKKTVTRMGRWVDFDNGYRTMDPDYMETIWWVFKTIWDKGLIYEGDQVQPYCPRCTTPLSNFETNQGYKDVTDPSITVTMPLKDEENTFLLVWTTTPWTLFSNVAVAVGKDIDYVKIKDKEQNVFYILAKTRLGAYYDSQEKYEIIKNFKGKDLLNKKYIPLFDYFVKDYTKIYFTVPADFVSTEDGTGLVHMAPAFGEDDFKTGKQFGLPVINTVDESCCFTSKVPEFKGMFVKDADKLIIKELKARGRLVRRSTIKHSYPHCYRCDAPLIYKTIKTWFLKIDPIKKDIINNNEQINWVPQHLKHGRFGKWLENARDWNLSRNRYWGAPIPVWKCENGHKLCVGSKKELENLSNHEIKDLHKHIIDKITFECPQCGSQMKRTPEVLDCWFESGSMPYAQNHYPFENKERVEKNLPADFIAEGLDQTRGWFYTLMVISTALFNRPAFKNVIVNGLILAEDGKKMSKRLKNYPTPEKIINKMGADALRMFLIDSPAVKAEDLKFSEQGIKDVLRTVIIPLWNAYNFFVEYAITDKWDPTKDMIKSSNELDRWILSVLQSLIKEVNFQMETYNLYKVVPVLDDFIDELTNWYIRRSRGRFWSNAEKNPKEKREAHSTLYTVLCTFSKIIAPILPFITEEMYQNLVRSTFSDAPISVHHCDYPKPDFELIDKELENTMAVVRCIVKLGNSLRSKYQIKKRQPLNSITVVTLNKTEQNIAFQYKNLIKEELNVKDVIISEKEEDFVCISAKANFKILGKRYGKRMKDAADIIAKFDMDTVKSIENGEQREVLGEKISKEDIIINRLSKKDTVIETKGSITIILDTQISDELRKECFALEFKNRVNNLRKEAGFDKEDRIELYFETDSQDLKKALFDEHNEFIKRETLALSIKFGIHKEFKAQKQDNVDGNKINIAIRLVN